MREARRPTEQKKADPPCQWIEENVIDPTSVNSMTWDFTTAKRIKLAPFQRRILTHVLTLDKNGLFPYQTVVWSQIKKSGKTQIAGAVGAYFAAQIEAPNLVLTIANNQEQSAGRIFDAMKSTLKHLGSDVPTAKNATPQVQLANGTLVKAIPNNYAGEAGANYGLTLWSELWAFTSERGRRLYEELVPVPTRKNSLRWVETYAGFEDESDLLLDIFLRIFTDTSEQKLQANARPVEALKDITTGDGPSQRPTCYEVPEAGLFVFWDHDRRMPWQQGEQGRRYYAAQAADLRPSAFVRLCENRWQKSEGRFIPEDWFGRTVDQSVRVAGRRMVLAIDASQRHDTTSLVGVVPPATTDAKFETPLVEVWDPKGRNIDLEETVAARVVQLVKQKLVRRVYDPKTGKRLVDPETKAPVYHIYYDPTQMHQVAMNLKKKNIACIEFQQGKERTKADTFLYQCYRPDPQTGEQRIANIDSPELAEHVGAAKARELEGEQMRIIKGTTSEAGKIDATVAQSMAVWKASLLPMRNRLRSVLAQGRVKNP